MSVFNLQKLENVAAAGPKLEAHPVPVYEFGAGEVAYIAELSADERDSRLELSWMEYKTRTGHSSNEHYRAWVAAACWCDAARVFVAKEAADIERVAELLGKQSAKPVTRMFSKAADLNALTEEDVEDLKKNSPQPVSGSGTSPSELDLLAPVSGSSESPAASTAK